jgi:hypothetical protein
MTSESTERALVEALDAVKDRESFLAFVRALVADRQRAAESERDPKYNYGGSGWEWSTIEDYLGMCHSCADSATGEWFGPEPSWHSFATFLWMGKIYE